MNFLCLFTDLANPISNSKLKNWIQKSSRYRQVLLYNKEVMYNLICVYCTHFGFLGNRLNQFCQFWRTQASLFSLVQKLLILLHELWDFFVPVTCCIFCLYMFPVFKCCSSRWKFGYYSLKKYLPFLQSIRTQKMSTNLCQY
jgi:hypothetical protein